MIKGQLNMTASGKVQIYKINMYKKELLLTRSNTILPLMYDVIARMMGRFSIGNIDQIKVYNGGLLLATGDITQFIHPDTNQVTYIAIFNEDSFNGAFNEIALYSSAMGRVAELTSIDGSKTNAEQISITWTITLAECPDVDPSWHANFQLDGVALDGSFEKTVGAHLPTDSTGADQTSALKTQPTQWVTVSLPVVHETSPGVGTFDNDYTTPDGLTNIGGYSNIGVYHIDFTFSNNANKLFNFITIP